MDQRGDSLLDRVGSLTHELTHFVFWASFAEGAIKDEVEESVCEAMDKAIVRKIKKVLG